MQAYQADIKTQRAIERQLSILGEAVNMFDKMEPENTLVNARNCRIQTLGSYR